MTFYCDCGCPEGRQNIAKPATADISYETLKEIEANFIEGENQIPEGTEVYVPPEAMSAWLELANLTCEACYAPKADCKCYDKPAVE
jgi:hypothetical protein